ncbi:MFS transporter [Intrasporangium flavum]|uniref:MFS transporter n=1 Tax=Intrasporangium flavum TaxID=1428657 RepID=UPI00096ED888|nr:MFS transporter [Intrasporangium flavum]
MTRTPLYGLLTAEAISLVGTRISMIALPWFVLTTTGSLTQTGLVAAVELAPLVLFKVLGGPFVDRLGARRIAVWCDAGSALTVAAIPTLHLAGRLDLPLLLVLVGLAGALRGPGDGAKSAMVPGVASVAAVPLERVTGLHGAIERTASMAGAALAGVLVGVLGAVGALFVDAASFAVCAAVVLATTGALRPTVDASAAAEGPSASGVSAYDPSSAGASSGRAATYVRQLREGWQFLRRDPVLVALSAMVATTNLLDIAWTSVLMPAWGQQSGSGAVGIGTLLAGMSAASVLSALLAARYAARLPRYRTYLVGFLVAGLPRFVVLALGAPLWVCLLVFAASGFASGFLNPILGAVVFERIPPHLTGRVSSLNSALCWSLMPLGGVLGGLLASGLGLEAALWVVGGAYLAASLSPLLFRSFRGFDTRPAPAVRPADAAPVGGAAPAAVG